MTHEDRFTAAFRNEMVTRTSKGDLRDTRLSPSDYSTIEKVFEATGDGVLVETPFENTRTLVKRAREYETY